MSYEETLKYLYSSHPAFHVVGAGAYKPGLQNMRRVADALGNPQNKYPTIHVAGTNGKGSVSSLIAAALQSAGMKTGLYTSPHLVDYRERIRINGEMIPEEEVCRIVERLKPISGDLSFFEITTSIAFEWFAEQKVDIAVIEVGLGGRLDATNIITPLLSVITNIGYDHTAQLGNTLQEIAAEKAGIMKKGVPCVIGEVEKETLPVFLAKAGECGISGGGLETTDCRLWIAEQCNYLRSLRKRLIPDCQLKGEYQERNQQTAFVALRALCLQSNIVLSHLVIKQAFEHVCDLTGLRGRWEVLQEKPLTICDTGHNEHGIRTYICTLQRLLDERQAGRNMSQQQSLNVHLRMVFGMVADKDIDAVLALLPKEAVYYWTQASTPRALSSSELRMKGLRYSLIGKNYDKLEDAIAVARHDAEEQDIIFIGGSNYVVAEALPLF